MRRFKVTYTRGEHIEFIEGVEFTNGNVALEYYPDDEWLGARGFIGFMSMEYKLNEFGDTSIKWLDEEAQQ